MIAESSLKGELQSEVEKTMARLYEVLAPSCVDYLPAAPNPFLPDSGQSKDQQLEGLLEKEKGHTREKLLLRKEISELQGENALMKEEVSKLQSEKEKNEKAHTEEKVLLEEEISKLRCLISELSSWKSTSQVEVENKRVHTGESTSQVEENENKKVHTGENSFNTAKMMKNLENSISARNVTKDLLQQNLKQKVVCEFYKAGCCRFKTNCRNDHPKVCEAFENFGYKEGGCRQENCQSGLHLNVCKFFMRGKCKKKDCKWFHPKSLTQHKFDHKSGSDMLAHALSEISKVLALLMQENNKAHTGEKARGSS